MTGAASIPPRSSRTGVEIGAGTSVWDNVHIRHDARIGDECIVGEKTYIAYDVRIGNRVKINALVYICTAVTIEDGVMISAGTIFTNDRFPRATTPDLRRLRSSAPDEHTLPTLVREGATIGAGCDDRQRPDDRPLRDGRHGLAGHEERCRTSTSRSGTRRASVGCVCRCGEPCPALRRTARDAPPASSAAARVCGLRYADRAPRACASSRRRRELTPRHA